MLLKGQEAVHALAALRQKSPRWIAAAVDAVEPVPSVLVLASEAMEAGWIFDIQGLSREFRDDFGELICPVVCYRGKDLARGLLRAGFVLPARMACVEIVDRLIAGGRLRSSNVDELATRLVGERAPEPSKGIDELAALPHCLNRIARRQAEFLRRDQLLWVSRIEAAALPALAEIEHRGLAIDVAQWRSQLASAESEQRELRRELCQLLDGGQRIDGDRVLESDPELRRALQRSGYPVTSFKREFLAELPPPLGEKLVRLRELAKVTQSYGENFLTHVSADGRIRATFEQIGASTGRLACRSPNLQAMPKDSAYRACFRADEGRALITADYAGCELRIIAELSGEPVFCQVLADGGDLHARVAESIFGVPVSREQNVELRRRAKAINFGLAYGMGVKSLSRATGLGTSEARSFLDSYFTKFPRIAEFFRVTTMRALERGYAHTMTGRRLYLEPGEDRGARSRTERIAKNMPIQGTNADVMKIALARLRQTLSKTSAFVVNTVHDEIVVEADERESPELADLICREMRAAGAEVLRRVPLEAEVAIGRSWLR